MDIQALAGPIVGANVDAILVYLFEDNDQPRRATKMVDEALSGAILDMVRSGEFTGKAGQVAVLQSRGAIPARRVIVTGLGSLESFSVDGVRRAAAHAVQKTREIKAERVATVTPGTGRGGLSVHEAAEATVEGALLGLYKYHGQKTDDPPTDTPTSLTLTPDEQLDEAQAAIESAQVIAAGVLLARELVNLPPNICTPDYMADVAAEEGQAVGLSVQALEKPEIADLKMGAFLGVAQGSDTPPRFIIMEHNAAQADELDTLVLVGKGITFDTGGYNVKSAEGMGTMKADMAGAAAVIGAMRAIGGLNLPLHVVGLAPAIDNMINGHAYRQQEVVTASNGVTIEIGNTDAEGRMLLADALVYAGRYSPTAVVDIATLTGACARAMGTQAACLFSTDEGLLEQLVAAAEVTSERVWPMPLFPEYEKTIESQTADIKNTGGQWGGVGSSATFLKHFVDYPAWAHLDIAGLAMNAKDNPYAPSKGATGFGVRLLTQLARNWHEAT